LTAPRRSRRPTISTSRRRASWAARPLMTLTSPPPTRTLSRWPRRTARGSSSPYPALTVPPPSW